MKRLRRITMICLLLCLLICLPAALTGCGGTTEAQQLHERNKLPEDGVITREQMESIAGKDGTYEFYATDDESGIKYSWFYDGAKINNPVEQRLKVDFTQDKVEEVKRLADNAAVGTAFKLEEMSPAAPLKLKITLTEKWDADAVILCKLADGKPVQMAEAEIGTVSTSEKELTSLTFPVNETGGTYYLVGGRTLEKAVGSVEAAEKGIKGGEKDEATGKTAAHTCTISIDCVTLANDMSKLRNKEKTAFVPSDGWLLYTSTIEYTPGESAYDVLYRACRRAGYQMEASYTPMYGSYYIEGINQLYEFDAGELSGWMYSVNGWFPNYGCSSYEVKDGDNIRFRYTCDLGADIGGRNATQ